MNTPDSTDLHYYRLDVNGRWELSAPHRNDCADRIRWMISAAVADAQRLGDHRLHIPMNLTVSSKRSPESGWSVCIDSANEAEACVASVTAWERAGNLRADHAGQHRY